MKRKIHLILIIIFAFSIGQAQPGSIDLNFITDFELQNGGSWIYTLKSQADGKIIIGGTFHLPVPSGNKVIGNILRLQKNGKFDTSFKIGTGFNGSVISILIQSDEKILVAGSLGKFNGRQCKAIARLNIDGTFDTTFNPQDLGQYVSTFVLQPDDKIVLQTQNPPRIIRLNNDGSFDSTFNYSGNNTSTSIVTMGPNGTILVAGRNSLELINKDGSLDKSFELTKKLGLSGGIHNLVFQPNGKLLVSGNLKSAKDSSINNIIRLNSDGSLDNTFKTGKGFDTRDNSNYIYSTYLQKDGKIILGGHFHFFDGLKYKNLVRLNSDGSLDKTFKIGEGFDGDVFDIYLQTENRIIVVGRYLHYDTYLANKIIGLNVREKTSELNLPVSPNPNTGKFMINASVPIKSILIYDALGIEILRTELNSYDAKIDLSDRSSGCYFLKVSSENEIKCQKILKK